MFGLLAAQYYHENNECLYIFAVSCFSTKKITTNEKVGGKITQFILERINNGNSTNFFLRTRDFFFSTATATAAIISQSAICTRIKNHRQRNTISQIANE